MELSESVHSIANCVATESSNAEEANTYVCAYVRRTYVPGTQGTWQHYCWGSLGERLVWLHFNCFQPMKCMHN